MQIEKKNDKTQHLNITTDRTLWTVQSKLKAGSHRPINTNIQWFVVQCCRLIWQCEPASHHSMTYCQNRQFWKIHLFFFIDTHKKQYSHAECHRILLTVFVLFYLLKKLLWQYHRSECIHIQGDFNQHVTRFSNRIYGHIHVSRCVMTRY